MSKLKNEMVFKSLSEVYDYLNFTHLKNHTELTRKKLSYYCNWHNNGRKVIIDGVFDKPIEYKISVYKYKYEVGDIINVRSGKIKILAKTRCSDKNRKSYRCLCMKCNQEFNQLEYELEYNTGCPVCDNKKVAKGINDMWTTNPEVAKLLANKYDGFKHTKCSNKNVDWVCPECGETIKNIKINDVYRQGLSCPSCSDGISYPEKFVYNFFISLNIKPLRQLNKSKFDWIKSNVKYDFGFYVDSKLCLCEANGNQHYEECSLTERTLLEEQENDKYKEQLAKENNIKHYIILDCRYSDMNYIKNSIIDSELPKLLRFTENDIDWNLIHSKSLSSLKVATCNLWNSGIHDREILADKIGVSKGNVMKYIVDGSKIGLCNYNESITAQIGANKRCESEYQKNGNPFICNETKQVFGKASTMVNHSESLFGFKLYASGIINTLKGLQPNTKGFTFQYISREQFNSIKQSTPELAFGDYFTIPEPTTQSI